jgi:predicted esterase
MDEIPHTNSMESYGDDSQGLSIEPLNATTQAKKITGVYPPPFILPASKTHTHTLILLHGRGGNGPNFGPPFHSSVLSSGKTLAAEVPNMKFVFPTASPRRARAFNRSIINQWFDNWSLDDINLRNELQYEGLRESTAFLHKLIDDEARVVGLGNVFLGGLSQGCAMSLHAILTYVPEEVSDKGSFCGYIGMSGYFPFVDDVLENISSAGDINDEDDPFAASIEFLAPEQTLKCIQLDTANFIRHISDLPALEDNMTTLPFVSTPFILGHGTNDVKVRIKLGEQGRDLLLGLGINVVWTEYDEGHWYKIPDQLDDIAEFVRQAMMCRRKNSSGLI